MIWTDARTASSLSITAATLWLTSCAGGGVRAPRDVAPSSDSEVEPAAAPGEVEQEAAPLPAPEPLFVRADPGTESYAAIDSALEGEYLVPLGATWRYFVGTEEPSPDMEWTEEEFDDSDWKVGASPFGFGQAGLGTELEEFGSGVTTVYLRLHLEAFDPSKYGRAELEIPVNDGYVFYLDGVQEGRLHAGKFEERRAFDDTATRARGVHVEPLPKVDLTKKLLASGSLLAIQGLNHAPDEDDDGGTFRLEPRVWARYDDGATGDEARLAELRQELAGPEAEARLAYLEGRTLQRRDDFAAAIPHFLRAIDLDPEAAEPLERLVECHRATGQLGALAGELLERMQAGFESRALFDTWARIHLEDLGGSPTDIPELVSDEARAPGEGFFDDARHCGVELLAGRPLQVDCGAAESHDGDGSIWSRDRFHAAGEAVERRVEAGGEPGYLDGAVREADRDLRNVRPMYRVPLPPGPYEAVLHFPPPAADAPDGDDPTAWDVAVEGALAFRGHDPASGEGVLRFPVLVDDGFLELDLLPRSGPTPSLAAFEIHPLDPGRYREVAEAGAASDRAFLRVQAAESLALAGELAAAVDTMEAAAELPGFVPADGERLAALRDALLPELRSYASADDLAERRSDDAQAILAAVRAAADDDATRSLATYLDGRIHQVAGRLDEATVAFEELVIEGTSDAEPYVRMAECLRASHLSPEADGFLREAIDAGVPFTEPMKVLWLALNLDDLGRDPWEVVAELRDMGATEDIVRVSTNEEAPRSWEYTIIEPPATTWSRPSFDTSTWQVGPGAIGSGLIDGAVSRSLWNTITVFSRTLFELPGSTLLYPHVRTYMDDAGDVYLNGIRTNRRSYTSVDYSELPFKTGQFTRGTNVLGIYGFNVTGPSFMDAGIFEPIEDLVWILESFEEDGALRVNGCGDEYVAADGTVWGAERFAGHAVQLDVGDLEIAGTEDDALYRVQRVHRTSDEPDAWYRIPVPSARYRVTLFFAEVNESLPGERVYDVYVEGDEMLMAHDVAAEVGQAAADSHSIEVEVTDGWLDVDFTRVTGNPAIAAIEVVRLD